jgi:ATP-dependent DNA helicase recG
MVDLLKDAKYIKGVGPNRIKQLNSLGIYTLEDVISYYPRGYENRGIKKDIAELVDGEDALIEAKCVSKMTEIRIRKNMTIYKLVVRDETATCTLTWFNVPFLKKRFIVGDTYKFFGKVKRKLNQIEMMTPIIDEQDSNKNTGRIIPIYPSTYNLSQNILRKIIENALEEANVLPETIPEYLIKEYKLMGINEATKQIHFPNSFEDYNKARTRLVFEELLIMQLALLTFKTNYDKDKKGISFSTDAKMSEIIDSLPFKLTNAQSRVLEEIDKDMESKKMMNRLLQGDVGSGKTAVAMCAAFKAVRSNYQAAVMVPTAILATQHYQNFKKTMDKFDIRCELLISGMAKKQKEKILEELKQGKIDIIIGTHALLQENVEFNKLGLVITDEQHRFGVRQRSIINLKGENPDVLVMSATPIPRTLALILYGDLDISIIDELPPNRQKIDTFAVTASKEERVNNFIKGQIDEGRQAYVVCPLVEESDEINAKSVLEIAEKYKNEIFKDYRVEYIHGKLNKKDKEAIMEEFKNGKIDILISTTVIEVGVDVPNASIMVIENAERFGLATLHQLRGRVGRGKYKSYCILKYKGNRRKHQRKNENNGRNK